MTYPPRGMKADAAAAYLGISKSKFLTLPIIPREHGGNVLYDRLDLDAWFERLPYREQTETRANTCDGRFGVKG